MIPIVLKLINYLDTLPPLVVLLIALNNKGLRGSFILHFLVIQFVFNLSANILNELDWKNLYLYHLNCLFSFFTISLFYYQLFITKNARIAISAVGVAYTVFFFYNIYKWENVSAFNSNTFVVASFILCTYALFYYLKLFTSSAEDNILKSASFWFNTGIFSYYTINFFIFLTYNKLTRENQPLITIIWQIHNVVFFIMCIYFFLGTLCNKSQEK